MGTVDFDPGSGTTNLTSAGGTDIFISKLDVSGNFVWAKAIGGTSDETAYSVEVDAAGNIYATGSFKATVDFDPGPGIYNLSSAGQDVFVSKLDASGNLVWAKSMQGTSNAAGEGVSIALDASGNIHTTGYFKDTVDFDPGSGATNLTAGSAGDVFVSKLDASGNFVWAKKMGGTAADKGTSIKTDASGNVCIAGIFQTVGDFDPGAGVSNLTSAGQFDIFISKLDASGNLVWAKSFGGTNSDYGNALSIDASGNIYTAGQYFSIVDFDPSSGTYTMTSAGTWDIYINKLDASGNFVWAKSMGGSLGDEGFGLFADAAGYIYAAGKYRDTADFDPGAGLYNLTSMGDYDIYIGKYDPWGNLVWAESMGDSTVDYAYSIIADTSGNIYTVGTFDGTIDFVPGSGVSTLTSGGQGDVFVHKMSQSITNEHPGNDYDGDGVSDLAIMDGINGKWYIESVSGSIIAFGTSWGWSGALPVPGDYNGDGVNDLAVFDNNTGLWFVLSADGQTLIAWAVGWGWPGAVPVPGDYDGDGTSDFALFDSNTGSWFVLSADQATILVWAVGWGWPGAAPVPGDYNGDGESDFAVLDTPSGNWFVLASDRATILAWARSWGWNGAISVPGDYNGGGKSDFAVFDSPSGNWFILASDQATILAWAVAWGWPGAVPVPGDYDGDGVSDLAVFDSNTGFWYVRTLSGTQLAWAVPWGWPGAVPSGGRD
ncbi:MAG: hypothetical protein HY343_13020 [Lentisphaerae bacterium]|nr:hypothetical protein [Lentisphaerota bacterium]